MGTRRYLVGGLIAALAAASVSGVAFGAAGQTQAIDGQFIPRQLPNKKNKRKPIALRVITTTANPQAQNKVPSPATKASINFDNAGRVYPGVAAKCSESQIVGKDTASARAACPNAVVGGGTALVFVPDAINPSQHGEFNVEVTAFNSAPVNGRPAIILHTYTPGLLYAQDLVGVYNRSTAGPDYNHGGVRLDVTIPLLPLDAALTRFDTTVGNGYKRGYVKSNCSDRNHRLNVKARFTYKDGSSLPAKDSQKCK